MSNSVATKSEPLAIGTPVTITAEGVWMQGTKGTIERAYTIRHGHHMYDIRSTWGDVHTYYAESQLTVG